MGGLNDLIINNRFDEEKRDKLMFDLSYSVTIVQLYLDIGNPHKTDNPLHNKFRTYMDEAMTAAKGNNRDELNGTINAFGSIAKTIISEFEKELNSFF